MPEFEFSSHARWVILERSIQEEWVQRTIDSPDSVEVDESGNTHFMKSIPERGKRWLRVVVNTGVTPRKIVTVFFDRRLRTRK